MRVRLQSGEGNRDGVGAILRLESNEKLGPARVVRLGSGFLSQNATNQILGGAEGATALRVVWASGGSEWFDLTPGQVAITAVEGRGRVVVD